MSPGIVADPRSPKNLAGLTTIALRYETSTVNLSGFEIGALREGVADILEDAGLKVDNKSKSRLVIGAVVETRQQPAHIIYGVEVALREQSMLPRSAFPPKVGWVDTWRHQVNSGILMQPFSQQRAGKSLLQAALRQVEVFVEDWQEQIETEVPSRIDPEPILPNEAAEKHRTIKDKLREILLGLAIGDESLVTFTRYSVSGNEVSFAATITHRSSVGSVFGGNGPIVGRYAYVIKSDAEGKFDSTDKDTIAKTNISTKVPGFFMGLERTVSLAPLAELLK